MTPQFSANFRLRLKNSRNSKQQRSVQLEETFKGRKRFFHFILHTKRRAHTPSIKSTLRHFIHPPRCREYVMTYQKNRGAPWNRWLSRSLSKRADLASLFLVTTEEKLRLAPRTRKGDCTWYARVAFDSDALVISKYAFRESSSRTRRTTITSRRSRGCCETTPDGAARASRQWKGAPRLHRASPTHSVKFAQ